VASRTSRQAPRSDHLLPVPARRTLRGINQQIAKAENAVAGKTSVKRNRFITITGATRKVNRALEAKAKAVAGLKG
jgi:hypothetical protein